MEIKAEIYGHAVMLIVSGELTEDSLTAFEKQVEHHLNAKDVVDLVLNFEGVPFIDSVTLEYLLDVQERLNERFGQVKLVKCDENVKKILEITGLESTFEQYDKVADAVKAI